MFKMPHHSITKDETSVNKRLIEQDIEWFDVSINDIISDLPAKASTVIKHIRT